MHRTIALTLLTLLPTIPLATPVSASTEQDDEFGSSMPLTSKDDSGQQAGPPPPEPRPVMKAATHAGLGLNLGFMPGFKVRLKHRRPGGLLLGVDFDGNTILFASTLSASFVVGYAFTPSFRTYLSAGGGRYEVVNLGYGGDDSGRFARLGAGIEWSIRKWFGIGLEGGVASDLQPERTTYYEDYHSGEGSNTNNFDAPYVAMTVMFYAGS